MRSSLTPRPLFVVLSILFTGVLAARAARFPAPAPHATAPRAPKASLARLPLIFERNVGQAGDQVDFLARANGYSLGVSGSTTLLALRTPRKDSRRSSRTGAELKAASVLLRTRLVGANPYPKATGEKRLAAKIHSFRGDDPKQWHTDIPAYEQVRLSSVYPGIDVVHYGHAAGALEYDFVVAPQADPGLIRFAVEGADAVRLAENGDLVLQTAGGAIRQQKPVCYQEDGGAPKPVDGEFVLATASPTVSFRLGDYDRSRTLIIDPVLNYSTYVGGSAADEGTGIATDGAGRAYVTGNTESPNFPTKGQLQPDQSAQDAFVTVLDPTKTGAASLLYSTYLGGSNTDWAFGIAADNAGRAYVTGYTYSTDLPTKNQFQKDPGDGGLGDGFVTALDTTKSGTASLLYSTYLGGTRSDSTNAIVADSVGRVFVSGDTDSSDFPTKNAFQPNHAGGQWDACFSLLDTTKAGAASLIYSTYLGGSAADFAWAVAWNGGRLVYVAGDTQSPNFPTRHEFQTRQGNLDAFVTVVDIERTGADSFGYSTYLGGTNDDSARGLAAVGLESVLVTGYAESLDFPLKGQFQGDQRNDDAFVTLLNTDDVGVDSLRYSTYLGGEMNERAFGIAADSEGRGYVTGSTTSTSFPTKDALQNTLGDETGDAFVSVIDPAKTGAASLLFSTYLGGDLADRGLGIAVDAAQRVFVTGFANSTNFPQKGQFQGDQPGTDAFVSVISTGNLGGTLSAPELLKFGTVKKGKEKQLPLELRNTHASQTLQVAVGTPSKGFAIVSGGGEFTLAPGASHTVTLSFKGKKPGAKRGKLLLTTSDPAHPTFEVGLKAKVR